MSEMTYVNGMDYGIGVDSLNGMMRGDSVIRTQPEEITNAAGQTVTYFLTQIERTEDLEIALGISAEAEGSFLGLFGGSAKIDFVHKCKYNEYSVFLLVYVTVSNAFRQMRDVKLKPEAWNLLKDGKWERFREQYGDFYVRGMLTGGEYFSIIEIETTSQSDFTKLKLELEASGIFGAFEAATDFSLAISKVTKNRQLKVTSFQRGGTDTTVPKTIEEVRIKSTQFAPTVVGEKSVPYAVMLQDYKALDLPTAPNFIDLQNARDVLEHNSRLLNRLYKYLNNVDYVLFNPQQFVQFDSKKLSDNRNKVVEALNLVKKSASACADSVKSCTFPQPGLPDLTLPERITGSTGRPQIILPTPKRQVMYMASYHMLDLMKIKL